MRFGKDDIILKDMICLDEKMGRGTEAPLERVRRAVWEMPYADDAAIVSSFPDGLARMMTVVQMREPETITTARGSSNTTSAATGRRSSTPGVPPVLLLICEGVCIGPVADAMDDFLQSVSTTAYDQTEPVGARFCEAFTVCSGSVEGAAAVSHRLSCTCFAV